VAVAVTLNGLPADAEPGAETLTLETLMSLVAVTLVLAVPLPLLLAVLGSETWSWFTVTEAEPLKLWAEGLEQVTDHVFWT
jgi:hypothetical protein